jgi:hypothetical protein
MPSGFASTARAKTLRQGGGKTRERKRRKKDIQSLEGVGGGWILLFYIVLFSCVMGVSALVGLVAHYNILK